ncbi:MAG: hypothetical protein ABI183_05700 [Polyangiaceae bacterium]
MARNQKHKLALFLASNLAAGAFFFAPHANAQSTLLSPTGGKGQLVFDNITGLRGDVSDGVSYAGDVGFSIQSLAVNETLPGGVTATETIHATTFWLAPQADYFVINHLSIGGLVEIASTSRSASVPVNGAVTQTQDLGSTTDITLLPRLGWMFALGDRFGIWPRAGIGYASRHGDIGGAGNSTFSGVVLNATCPFLYRINETFFVELSPDLTFIPGSVSQTNNANQTQSVSGTYFDFAATGGLGIMLDL